MIDNTILGYAVLTYYSDKGKDVLDAYIPLFCNTIFSEELKKVDRDTIKVLLSKRYGLQTITLGAIDSILKRMVSEGYLKWDHHELCVVEEKIIEFNEEHPESGINQEYDSLISRIAIYAKDSFSEDYHIDDIDRAVLSFLDSHGAEMLLDREKVVKTLSQKKVKKQINYVISNYILYAYDNKRSEIDLLLRLAKGRILARVVTLTAFDSYVGKLDQVQVALDAPVIFNLLGLNGESGYNLTHELLDLLRKHGAKFIIFNNNYSEITNTLNTAIWRLRTHNWEYDKSSRVLKYAIRNRLNSYFIQTKLSQVDDVLNTWGIERTDAPEYPARYKEIDIERLTEIISRKYSKNGEIELDENQKERIATDVDSISFIFRIRGNIPATNLRQCRAILVTNNVAISYASNDGGISMIRHNIPACVTDVFLSTILWTAYPGNNAELNEKVLLCECSSNILLDDDIIKKYYKKVNDLYKHNKITKEQVLILTSTNVAMDLLERNTLNDPERYTDETPEEILREIEETQNRKINNANSNLSRLSHKIALWVFWIIWSLFTFVFSLKFIDYSNWNAYINLILGLLQFLTCFWGVLSWGGLIWTKANIITYIEKKTFKLLSDRIFKDSPK